MKTFKPYFDPTNRFFIQNQPENNMRPIKSCEHFKN